MLPREHEFPLRQLHVAARHLMSEEAKPRGGVVSSSGAAWAKLHDNLTSQITARSSSTAEQTLPMSAIRNLAMEPDRDLRHRAWQAELGAWERMLSRRGRAQRSQGQVLASPPDGIGPILSMNLSSGAPSTVRSSMSWSRRRAALPEFRRYLRLKAKLLGITDLAWYDLFAPVG